MRFLHLLNLLSILRNFQIEMLLRLLRISSSWIHGILSTMTGRTVSWKFFSLEHQLPGEFSISLPPNVNDVMSIFFVNSFINHDLLEVVALDLWHRGMIDFLFHMVLVDW